jgi:hypothetical protein
LITKLDSSSACEGRGAFIYKIIKITIEMKKVRINITFMTEEETMRYLISINNNKGHNGD